MKKHGGSRGLKHDGKSGWCVVIGAFIAHVITHGIVYSFGMMFNTLEITFHASKSEIAWIPSIMSGALYLIGPVASILINKFGCRAVTILGACIGFIGYILSIFISNLYLLYITMGLIPGCGFGLVFLSAIVIVTQHFIKYRAIACGIGLSGAGVGAFIFSPLIERLLDVYDWRGTLLILSAIILNCIVASLAFKPQSKQRETVAEMIDEDMYPIVDNKENIIGCDFAIKACDDGTIERQVENIDDPEENVEDKLLATYNVGNKYDDVKNINRNGVFVKHDSENGEEILIEIQQVNKMDATCSDIPKTSHSLVARQLLLMKNAEFVAFILSQLLFFIGFYLPFIYIPGKAHAVGVSEESTAWIGSTIGLSSVTGRIALGYVADRTSIDRYVMFKAALIIAGISTSFGPLLNHYWSMILYAVIYGISTGITLSLTSVVLVDLIGIQLLPDAMGLNNLLSGLGSLLGPPAAGLLYDKTGSYTATFLIPGVAMTVSGVVLVLTGCQRKQNTSSISLSK